MMGGDKHDADLKGIIPRAGDDIFETVSRCATDVEFDVRCSYLEVYRER